MRIYIDTSVINGFYCQDFTIKAATKAFFDSAKLLNYTLYGSELVANEIRGTPNLKLRQALIKLLAEFEIEVLPISEEANLLSQRYVSEHVIPAVYIADAIHIAIATIHNIPILVSWNFEHIVKHRTRIEVNRINTQLNLPQIDICSPQEV